jgi:hypothetical protein
MMHLEIGGNRVGARRKLDYPSAITAPVRVVLLVVSILLAVPLTLYGAFAILYTGESGGGGETYVKIAGRKVDADLAGAVALILALGLFAVGFSVMRRSP